MQKLLKFIFVVLLVASSAFGFLDQASAAKLDLSAGAFQFETVTDSGAGALSNIGTYRMGYSLEVLDSIEVGLGYTLIASEVFTGDLAFGFDIFARYFPLTNASEKIVTSDKSVVRFSQEWRPFVGGSFNQRQFQSVATNFAGFGVSIGTEKQVDSTMSFLVEGRYIALNGPRLSSATEISAFVGISLLFR